MGTRITDSGEAPTRSERAWVCGFLLAGLFLSETAAAQSTFELFSLGDYPAEMHAVSADGSVAVGRAIVDSWGERPVIWRRGHGFSMVDDGLSLSCSYLAISADGNTVAGAVVFSDEDVRGFFAPIGSAALHPLTLGQAMGLSSDASALVGSDFRWEREAGLSMLAPAGDRGRLGRGISRGGQVMVGQIQAGPPFDNDNLPCRWFDEGRSYAVLPQLPGIEIGSGSAFAANADGRVIVGYASDPVGGQWVAVRWVDGVPERLGIAPGCGASAAYAVNPDGSIVVGYSANGLYHGSMWTRETGTVNLDQYLRSRGVQIPEEWQTFSCNAVSDDGSVFAGIAMSTDTPQVRFRAFVATLRPPCPADFNLDGGVDGADVESFFLAWQVSQPTADTNADGGVDGADVETFFVAWEAAGCE